MKSSIYFQSPASVEQFRPAPTELAAQCMANDRARHQKVFAGKSNRKEKTPTPSGNRGDSLTRGEL